MVLIINVLVPGVGTMAAGCVGENDCGVVCTGMVQLLLSPFFVGWIWAIIWSVKLYSTHST